VDLDRWHKVDGEHMAFRFRGDGVAIWFAVVPQCVIIVVPARQRATVGIHQDALHQCLHLFALEVPTIIQ